MNTRKKTNKVQKDWLVIKFIKDAKRSALKLHDYDLNKIEDVEECCHFALLHLADKLAKVEINKLEGKKC